jgi:hypothetical protein
MRTIHRGARSTLFALLLAACGGGDGATPPDAAVLEAAPTTLALSEAQPMASVFLTTNPVGRSLAWRVASKPDWLTLSVDSGTVKGTSFLTATMVVPATQDPGLMSGKIEIAYPTGNVTVPVTAMVLASAHVVITPASLAFAESQNTVELTLTNPGHGGVSWTASSPVSWLRLSSAAKGFLGTGQSVVLVVTVNRASLPPGTSSGSIGIFSGAVAVPVQIPVTVAVAVPPAP